MSAVYLQLENSLLKSIAKLADAAQTAADAYAKKTGQANITVNVNYDPRIDNVDDISQAVRRAVRQQDR